ncbi:hypothetical protein [Shewanella frigidimarina]|uniref:hypothetical protein n=1 Tax=Shewanella frigidimarina TaxID=56812 RepID=UPI003D7984C3
MISNPLVQVCITLGLGLISFIALQNMKKVRIYNLPVQYLNGGFLQARLSLSSRLLINSFFTLSPLSFFSASTVSETFVYTAAFSVFFGLLIDPKLQIKADSKLVVTKSLFHKKATIHLKHPYQDFCRNTYTELLDLVEILPTYKITAIQLSSPMFYHSNNTLRSLDLLEKLLIKHGAEMTHSKDGFLKNILGKATLYLDSSPYKKAKINNINLHHWHTINITLK